jgi:fibronectin type 3 domain-containing protein
MVANLMSSLNRVFFGAACTLLALLVILLATFPQKTSAQACTLNASDMSSLISAINTANSNADVDTICLATGSYTFTTANNTGSSGGNALPIITTEMIIEGNGATITRSGSANFRFIEVDVNGNLTLNDVTMTNGRAEYGHGGAV